MAKKIQGLSEWRLNILEKHLLTSLIILFFILSIIFLFISIITGNIYFRGVAIGLIISWSTCLIALIFKKIIYKNLIKVVK
ncbi:MULTISPECIES: hypothetical protein [Acidiplasma]|jgi:hypothetical protein|uniref:Uncharacterized protein n=1 Tax=Acidiplasma cupricumulans TaxID=312540 RepID=A0A0Q0XM87_9ARCH|nr:MULTISPECIES: hypothetical protein [unclassified Acidiplasma]KJE49284.1 hypothetical protein TZ01_04290 [Acidiplasma sp. MBA-1]KQB36671.1 hypothetical protein AOG55_03440 [Acidiplasma cupricumulans]WMT54738.1 MAG: hypothetical protein RE470_07445 [Acidiplasma sp.]